MFGWLGDVPEAAPVFEAAAAFLDGADPRRFVRDADDAALFGNRAGQILCCTQALAAWAMIGERRPAGVVLAGYSVGELAAWGCAGLFAPAQVLALAASRAAVMDAAAPAGAGLAAIVGLRRAALDAMLAAHGGHVAIHNGPESVVIGADGAALAACLEAAIAGGARTARRLPVAVPSHTALLASASPSFGTRLQAETLGVQSPGVRLLSGIDGAVVRDTEAGLLALAAQISTTIDWAACLDSCRELGARRFLELGPGAALAAMAAELGPDVTTRAVGQFRSRDGVLAWLGA